MMGKEKSKKKPFKCEFCGFEVASQVHFERHLRSHTGEKPYVCPLCEKAFSIESNFRRHVRTHSGEKPFKCDVCSGRFTAKESLVKHMRRHSGENLYSCDVCGQSFTQSSHLNAHKRIHSGERNFKCPTCEKSFNNKYTFKLHCTMHENTTHTCQGCGKVFDHLGTYQQHIRRHMKLKNYACSVCGQQFKAHCVLQEHYSQVHAKEKHYHCPVCGKKFCKIAHLRRHTTIHKKFKPFLCTVCNVRFADETQLNEHVDEHSRGGFFYCDCDKKLGSKSKFKLHMTTHECGAMQCFGSPEECKSMNGLREYKQNFTVSFLCPLCDRIFERKVNVILHAKTVHKDEEEDMETLPFNDSEKFSKCREKPHKCTLCDTYFTRELSLKWHEVCVHKVVKEIETPTLKEHEKQRSELDTAMGGDNDHQEGNIYDNDSYKEREGMCVQNGNVSKGYDAEGDQTHEGKCDSEESVFLECDVSIKNEPVEVNIGNVNHVKAVVDSQSHSSIHFNEQFDHNDSSKPTPVDVKKLIIETYMNQYRKSFQCSLCRKKFRSLDRLECHMGYHTGENPFHCTICSLSFKKKSSLKLHVLSHGTGSMQCPHCHICFSSKKGFKRHLSFHKDKLLFCSKCNRKFLNASHLEKHLILHNNEELNCNECHKTFSSENSLKMHQKNGCCRMKNYRCFFCMRVFRNKSGAVRHVRVTHASAEEDLDTLPNESNSVFKCHACDLVFLSKQSFVWHKVCIHKLVEEADPLDVEDGNECEENMDDDFSDDPSLEEKTGLHEKDFVVGRGAELIFSEPINESLLHIDNNIPSPGCLAGVKKENDLNSENNEVDSRIIIPENEIFIKEEAADNMILNTAEIVDS